MLPENGRLRSRGETLPLKGGKECILFIDDEDLLVELNHERLIRLGYEVVVTTTASQQTRPKSSGSGSFC
ncbi:MAG: hypothetical protein A4E65_03513 [Syntrophorhabdus sp. PtaU1.Bin153]|nr:MAG: hypothetical protein A4E65_03513 [Syntrophorhabdus sp. PtaU1.Bin153]